MKQRKITTEDALRMMQRIGSGGGGDGFSPTISYEEITNGYRLTVVDIEGTKSIDIMHGGSPTITLEETASGVMIETLNPNGTNSAAYVLHGKDEWRHVISQIRKYEEYTEAKGIVNGVIDEDAHYLRELYQHRMESHAIRTQQKHGECRKGNCLNADRIFSCDV